MDQKTAVLIPKYETLVIPQEEIDKIVSPEDFVPKDITTRKRRILKKIVRYMDCPTCRVVTGHRRVSKTLNQYSCCVCGHTVPRIDTEPIKIAGMVGGMLAIIGAVLFAVATVGGEMITSIGSTVDIAIPQPIAAIGAVVAFLGIVWVIKNSISMC